MKMEKKFNDYFKEISIKWELTTRTKSDTIKLTVRACTGFDRPAEDGEAIRGL